MAILKTPNERDGVVPMMFDILGPDRLTSFLPQNLKLVLHTNPHNLKITHKRNVQQIQTKGGYVIQHWGSDPSEVALEGVSGGFQRLYTGVTSITGGPFAQDLGGTRRDTLAYDRFLDLLALFHHNGALFGPDGLIVLQGSVRMTFNGQEFDGFFSNFSFTEDTSNPFMFKFSAGFIVEHERQTFRMAGF